jgi:hypothetical protein
MKRILFLMMAAVLFLGTTGCDKEGAKIKRADILGDWIMVKYNGNPYMTVHRQTYNADGSFNQLMIINDVPVPYTGTWSMDEKERTVTITKNNNNEVMNVVALNGNKLEYKDLVGDTFELARP